MTASFAEASKWLWKNDRVSVAHWHDSISGREECCRYLSTTISLYGDVLPSRDNEKYRFRSKVGPDVPVQLFWQKFRRFGGVDGVSTTLHFQGMAQKKKGAMLSHGAP